MAGNNAIQILRGKTENCKKAKLIPGQPLFDKTTGYLYVGSDAEGERKQVVARTLLGTSNLVDGASLQYSIEEGKTSAGEGELQILSGNKLKLDCSELSIVTGKGTKKALTVNENSGTITVDSSDANLEVGNQSKTLTLSGDKVILRSPQLAINGTVKISSNESTSFNLNFNAEEFKFNTKGNFEINHLNANKSNSKISFNPLKNSINITAQQFNVTSNVDSTDSLSVGFPGNDSVECTSRKNIYVNAPTIEMKATTSLILSAPNSIKLNNNIVPNTSTINVGAIDNPFDNVYCNTLNTRSDSRYKTNIRKYKNDKSLLDVEVKLFNYKDNPMGEEYIGVIAQDVKEVCPNLVKEDIHGYLSLKESKLVYVLLYEVQKLRQEINTLKGNK